MKKGNKRFFALLLAALLTLTALSCAKEETPSADPGNNTPAKTDAPSSPDAPAEETPSTDDGEEPAMEDAVEQEEAEAETSEETEDAASDGETADVQEEDTAAAEAAVSEYIAWQKEKLGRDIIIKLLSAITTLRFFIILINYFFIFL